MQVDIIYLRFEKIVPKERGDIGVNVIEQKYTLQKQIGSGLSCVVYLAEHKKLHQTCAIKCISKRNGNGNTFLRETEFLRNLRSIYVPALYDYEEDTDYWYLIEEYIAGYSLKDLKQNQRFISQDKLMESAIRICEAVKWLHDRKPYPLLYLDLKPEHIIVSGDGLKLLDFGSAVYLKGNQMSGRVMGTVGFASPEQLQGSTIDLRSDIYSIGAVLYWLMTGEMVGDEGVSKKVSGYSKEWNAIISRCVEQDKNRRYASAGELLKDLQRMQKINNKGQFGKSLKIAVIGSQRRVGVTHFSIGLAMSSLQAGVPCLYEERNESGAIQELFSYSKKAREKEGIYYFPKFEAIPRYGNAVCTESYGECMFVYDYGVFREELVFEYEEADCVIAVTGGKEWERKQTKDLIERYRKRRNMYYVLRTGSKADFRIIAKELAIPAAFYMPDYGQPFSLGNREKHFYHKLLKQIHYDLGRRIEHEKDWNLFHYHRHNRNR